MIDGIKIFYRISDFEKWKSSVKIQLFTPTDLDTGEAKGVIRHINACIHETISHRGIFETFRVTVKETIKRGLKENRSVSHLLILEGSLHKNHFEGRNYLPFTFENLCRQIEIVEDGLQLISCLSEIVNLEFGVNISVPFPVYQFLSSNLLVYKNTPFNRYNPERKGVILGFVCPFTQYSVKVYDKGKQYGLPYNLMRFELRFLKMQPLKFAGIKMLSDLKDRRKVDTLKNLLVKAWRNVLLSDHTIDLCNSLIQPKEREILRMGSNPKYWEALSGKNKRQFNYNRAKFRKAVLRYGSCYQMIIEKEITSEWERLFNHIENVQFYR